MANFIDYVNWRGDLTFNNAPFNPVDAMILTELAYYNFDGAVPSDFQETPVLLGEITSTKLLDPLPNYCTKEDLELWELVRKSERFSGLRMIGFVNDIDIKRNIQFCAVTFLLSDKLTFVAFRGTDDSLVGWKENLDLAYTDKVPAQQESVEYLKKAAKAVKGKLIVGGHSKGGNLAVYSSAFTDKRITKRVTHIYNFDGPGFNERVIEDEHFQSVTDRIHTYVPQDSLIGLLLEHKESYSVIHSSESSGASQHRLYTWEVTRDSFVPEEKITKSGEKTRENISEWIRSMSYEEKHAFIETLYELVDDYKTTDELLSLKTIWHIISEYGDLSDEKKHTVSGAVKDFTNTVFGNLKDRVHKLYDDLMED